MQSILQELTPLNQELVHLILQRIAQTASASKQLTLHPFGTLLRLYPFQQQIKSIWHLSSSLFLSQHSSSNSLHTSCNFDYSSLSGGANRDATAATQVGGHYNNSKPTAIALQLTANQHYMHANIMDSKASRASAKHHCLPDTHLDINAASSGHHDLNCMDYGACNSSTGHHQTTDIGEAPSQLPNDDRHHQSEAQTFTATCVDTENNSGLLQDDRLHQTATHIYVGAAPTPHTQSRMTTESCYLAIPALPTTQHLNVNVDVQPSLALVFATTIAMVYKATMSPAPHCKDKNATQRVESLDSHLQGKEQLTSFQWTCH